ncbi:MAG: selenoprotein B [Gammaproteobacteria bacterium]
MPIAYIDHLNRLYRSLGFPPYDWTVNHTAPFTSLARPLNACTVALLTTGGISRRDAPPWNPDARNDFRLDAIPADTPADAFQVHDHYYDDRAARTDINCQFPLTRLAELAAEGVIGGVARRHWSGFMGRIYKRSDVVEVHAPAFAACLREDDVDLLVLIPACPLDHQTAGLVARVVEEHGIATVMIATARDLAACVRPPRTLFVDHPMGNALGRAGDAAGQRAILSRALALAVTAAAPGVLIDDPSDWGAPFEVYYKETTREYQSRK